MSVVIKKYEQRHPKLGRHVRHDSRSLDFAFQTRGLTIQSVVHPRFIPILDQGDVGSCTAESGIGSLGTQPIFQALPPGRPYSLDQPGALHLYSDEETLNGDGPYPPNDNGSDGLTCAKVLKRAGMISAYQHCFDVTSALQALSVTPFMFGCDWTNKMFTPDPDGRVHIIGPVAGGHEILCRQYDMLQDRLWFDNSWNISWGVQGRFYLTTKDFTTLLSRNGDVTIPIPFQTGSSPFGSRRRRHHHHHGKSHA